MKYDNIVIHDFYNRFLKLELKELDKESIQYKDIINLLDLLNKDQIDINQIEIIFYEPIIYYYSSFFLSYNDFESIIFLNDNKELVQTNNFNIDNDIIKYYDKNGQIQTL